MIGRVLCWLGRHDWRMHLVALVPGVRPVLRCARCQQVRAK